MAEDIANKKAQAKPPAQGLPLLPIAILALIVIAVLVIGPSPGANWPKTPANGTNATNMTAANLADPSARILLTASDKFSNLPSNYQIKFKENIDGLDNNITLAVDGQRRMASVQTQYHERQYVWDTNATVVCERILDSPKICANLSMNTTAWQYAVRLNATFPAPESGDLRRIDQELVGMGAIKFIAAPTPKTIAGRSCDNIAYTFEFGSLSPADLAKIDRSLYAFKNYRLEKCIDRQTGIPLFSKLYYEYNGVGQTYERTYLQYFSPAAQNVSAPSANVNASLMDQAFEQDNRVLDLMGVCTSQANASERQACVLSAAINLGQYGLCAFAPTSSLRDECVYKLASIKGEPSNCAKAGLFEDECYAYAAYDRKDVSFCNIMANQTSKAKCLEAVAVKMNGTNASGAAGVPAPNQTAPANTLRRATE